MRMTRSVQPMQGSCHPCCAPPIRLPRENTESANQVARRRSREVKARPAAGTRIGRCFSALLPPAWRYGQAANARTQLAIARGAKKSLNNIAAKFRRQLRANGKHYLCNYSITSLHQRGRPERDAERASSAPLRLVRHKNWNCHAGQHTSCGSAKDEFAHTRMPITAHHNHAGGA